MIHAVHFFTAVCLITSSITDLTYHKIPNSVIITFSVFAPFFAGSIFIIRFSAALVIAYYLSRLRFIGGGDLKLLCILYGVYGFSDFISIVFISFIVCSAFSLILIIRSKFSLKSQLPIAPFIATGHLIWVLSKVLL